MICISEIEYTIILYSIFRKITSLFRRIRGKIRRKWLKLDFFEKIFRVNGEKFSENSLKTIEKKVFFVYTVL